MRGGRRGGGSCRATPRLREAQRVSGRRARCGSNDTVYWLCATGAAHWYPQRIDRKVQGYGCSVCSRRRLVLRVNDLATTDPLLVTEWHDHLNVPKRPEFMLAGIDRHWWKCAFGHVKQQSVPNRRKSRGCTGCEPEDRILN
ncbi:zinc-ribbon domain-containing protein [Curtobacterium sp. USHLN213]|uniref:zinc-ribbon domain-containing protein n=1 Tax=Curtobacterium sp. USHLN213 TaxID=3081255 RepID=UPI003FA55EDB